MHVIAYIVLFKTIRLNIKIMYNAYVRDTAAHLHMER